MKTQVISLNDLTEEINLWGVPAVLEYDESEEAYVIKAGNIVKGEYEVSIAPGFKHIGLDGKERIFCNADSLFVHIKDDHLVDSASRNRIISLARLGHFRKNKVHEISGHKIYFS